MINYLIIGVLVIVLVKILFGASTGSGAKQSYRQRRRDAMRAVMHRRMSPEGASKHFGVNEKELRRKIRHRRLIIY